MIKTIKIKKVLMILVALLALAGCKDNNENSKNQNNGIPNNQSINDVVNDLDDTEVDVTDDVVDQIVEERILMPQAQSIKGQLMWGYAVDGEFVIEPKYDRVEEFNTYQTALVVLSGQPMIINDQEEKIIESDYTTIVSFKDYYIGSYKDQNQDLLNSQGEIITTAEGTYNIEVENDQLFVRLESQLFALNQETDTLEALVYDDYRAEVLAKHNYGQAIQMNINDQDIYYYTKNGQQLGSLYDYAEPFENGYAIVGFSRIEEDNYYEITYYGLMDENGTMVLEMRYIYLSALGDGYYAYADKESIAMEDYFMLPYTNTGFKKGIYYKDQKLFDELFYNITYVSEDTFHVNDGASFYFLDEMNVVQYPHVDLNAAYDFSVMGNTVVATLGNNQAYFTKDTFIENNTYTLETVVIKNLIEGRASMQMEYPQLISETDAAIKINKVIDDAFNLGSYVENEVFYEEYDMGYDAYEEHGVLRIDEHGYYYGYGAAHGNYYVSTMHFDLETGELLTLEDLFEGNPYEIIPELLADYSYVDQYFYQDIQDQLREERIAYFTLDFYNFSVSEGVLEIYFNPYEVGPYAAGIIGFEFELASLEHLKKDHPFQ